MLINIINKNEVDEERKILVENIKKFLQENNVYNMMPPNSEVIAVDESVALNDLIHIYSTNDTNRVLCWSSEKKVVDSILITTDLLNFLIV